MPAEGINFAKKDTLLSVDELSFLAETLVGQGIEKIRLTGGEPFVRKDLMKLLRNLSALDGLKDISVTTNATLIGPYIEELKELGVVNMNVSLDAIHRDTFARITRRDQYDTVYDNLIRLIEGGFNVRVNFIVLEGQNTGDILPILELQKKYDISVRFLEEMPFNGGSRNFESIRWNYKEILRFITDAYPEYEKLNSPATSTSINYKIKGHKGSFGLIPSFSRTFCGSCNRLRITATGDVITCLYGKPKLNIREIIRGEDSKTTLGEAIRGAIGARARTGFEAQQAHAGVFESSMTSIGG
jgi:cyclic pyranopterin phosphate synthase